MMRRVAAVKPFVAASGPMLALVNTSWPSRLKGPRSSSRMRSVTRRARAVTIHPARINVIVARRRGAAAGSRFNLGGDRQCSADGRLQRFAQRNGLVRRQLDHQPPAALKRDAHHDATALLGHLERAIALLPPQQRTIVVLHDIEGYTHAEWVLMDYMDIVVHIFSRRAREYYDLERLWRDGKRLDVTLADGWYALERDPWVHQLENRPYVDLPKLLLDLRGAAAPLQHNTHCSPSWRGGFRVDGPVRGEPRR